MANVKTIQPYREHMKLMYNDTTIQRKHMKLMYNNTTIQGTHEANVK